MRFKPIEQIVAGDQAGADLFDLGGHLVVAKGSILTDSVIEKLKQQAFSGLYIDDFVSYDIDIKPIINPLLKTRAREAVKRNDVEEAIKYSKDIVDDIIKNGIVAMDMQDLKTYDDYTYVHSVNVAVLSCMVGMGLNLSERDMDELVLAGLLHDLGKYKIPEKLLNKPDSLNKDEYELIKKHPNYSYDIIEGRKDISTNVKNAVLTHHENEDGTGYPLGVTGKNISILAKIIHVVDIYDALITDKPYKKGYTPWEAAEYLMGACGFMFDKSVVDVFIKTVPLYQKGQEIVLSNGEHAIVLENTGDNNLRPIVRLIENHVEINLAERKHLATTFYTGAEWEKRLQEEHEKDLASVKAKKENRSRILVVDDMKMNRILLKSLLEEKYDLTFAESGEQAVDIIKGDKRYALIIMDIDMPGMSGTEAAADINRMSNEKIPIMFVSAIKDVQTVILCRELHAAGYITRPYQSVYVQTEVDRIISKAW